MELRIILADDHSMIRKGIQMLCKLDLGIAEVAEVASCYSLMKELASKEYTHLVLDINLSDGNTLEVIPEIRRLYPNLQITILSMQPESVYGKRLKHLGIYQFISKGAAEEQTFRMLKKFFHNEQIDPADLEKTKQNPFSTLTRRELEILHLILKGMGTSEIANALHLKQPTVSTLKNRIFERTKISNVMELKELAFLYKLT